MINIISQNLDIILIVIFFLFLFWNILLEIRLKKESKRTTSFFKGKKAEDLEEVISQILKNQRTSEKEIQTILEKIKKLEDVALHSIQKVGIIRFNPFEGAGGNQSFSLAILDQKDDGLVISSYHSKESTRIYAKPIRQGESKYPLTKEEEKAIKKAISH
ncbi:MAG: hypothetical protein CO034_02265 [Parcubacteria group bacterium CG_4_9_14_0_2_um_filter_35_11]|nr:MAG: hypothetical protein CO034_02265 [Parcubacteria group bacterium CG_4_9_14_0_2_um_filter_35_11]